MCKFEMAIHTASVPNKRTSPSNNDSRFPRKFATPSRYYSKVKEPTEIKETTVFFKINENVYQVDLGQIEHLEVELGDNEETSKPPSLLIQFTICAFRVFSMTGVAADQFSALNGAKTRLFSFLTSDYFSPFPANVRGLASPTGSSSAPSSSNEPGQKEISRQMIEEEEKSMDQSNEKATVGESSETCSDSKAQDCLDAYYEAREQLKSLERTLKLPVKAERVSSSAMRDHVSATLNAVSENVASSFCTRSTLGQGVQTQKQRINEYHVELDGILKSYWPNTRPRKRARLSDDSAGRSISSAGRQPQLPPADCIARTKEIMKKHREALRAKYSLSLLPGRG
jgi:hypothetical protein